MTGGRAEVLRAMVRYITGSAVLHLAWESLHLPLYTLGSGPSGERIFAVIHCTGGDVLIAGVTLCVTLILAGRGWPETSGYRVAAITTLLGVGYTIFSEWLNVEIRRSWAYAPSMPLVPPFGTGLTPLLQWLVLPGIALMFATRSVGRHRTRERRRQNRRDKPAKP